MPPYLASVLPYSKAADAHLLISNLPLERITHFSIISHQACVFQLIEMETIGEVFEKHVFLTTKFLMIKPLILQHLLRSISAGIPDQLKSGTHVRKS
jgi:hypothetical protein